MPDYIVTDRRRVTREGSRPRKPLDSKPRVPYGPIKRKVEAVWRHVDTHLRRSLTSGGRSQELYRTVLWGLALSVNQTHAAVATLLADQRKPKTLPLQGAILVRSLLEALGNVIALTAKPSSLRWFLADGYRRAFEQQAQWKRRWGGRAGWESWFAGMDALNLKLAQDAGLGRRRTQKPSSANIPDWPTPWYLTHPKRHRGRKRPLPVLLQGSRARLFEEVYSFWYSSLSAASHQRWAAVQQAIFSDAADAHWSPGAFESIVAVESLLFFACAMSELEVASRMPPSMDLRALWVDLWNLDEEVKRVVDLRYRRILRMPRLA
jgi:hypothetical protein